MLVKKVAHWAIFFCLLASFTLVTVSGLDPGQFASIEEAAAQGFTDEPLVEGDVLFDLPAQAAGMWDVPRLSRQRFDIMRMQRQRMVCKAKADFLESIADNLPMFHEENLNIDGIEVSILSTDSTNISDFVARLRNGNVNCYGVSIANFLLPFLHGGVS